MSTLAEAATEKDVYLSEFNRLEKELVASRTAAVCSVCAARPSPASTN